DQRKSVRPLKGIFCDDISEFESYMPSHAVGLSQVRSPAIVMGPSCVSTALQLKRERSLRARFAEANGQADLEDALGDLLRLFGVERRAPFHRHVDGGDRERLALHH